MSEYPSFVPPSRLRGPLTLVREFQSVDEELGEIRIQLGDDHNQLAEIPLADLKKNDRLMRRLSDRARARISATDKYLLPHSCGSVALDAERRIAIHWWTMLDELSCRMKLPQWAVDGFRGEEWGMDAMRKARKATEGDLNLDDGRSHPVVPSDG